MKVARAPRRRVVAKVLSVLLVAGAPAPRAAFADEPPAPTAARLDEAKALFQQGNVLRRAGDLRGALEFYLRSRAVVPSMPNTFNAAVCLHQLGRTDEALELYEEVLTKFRGQLDEGGQTELNDSITTLRRQLGSIEVTGNVGGMLLVDGRVRGTLPIVAPVRVQPGLHTVRVYKEGWEPFESKVTVEKGAFVTLDAALKPLAQAGRLHVESDNLTGGELILDGAPLGHLPWEGTLAPGPHLYSTKNGTMGTGPAVANVVQGQTVAITVHGVPLGSEVRVVVEPPSAEIWIDAVSVGKGQWRGSLPIGPHLLEAREVRAGRRLARSAARCTSRSSAAYRSGSRSGAAPCPRADRTAARATRSTPAGWPAFAARTSFPRGSCSSGARATSA
jgi:hypothetical protein